MVLVKFSGCLWPPAQDSSVSAAQGNPVREPLVQGLLG